MLQEATVQGTVVVIDCPVAYRENVTLTGVRGFTTGNDCPR